MGGITASPMTTIKLGMDVTFAVKPATPMTSTQSGAHVDTCSYRMNALYVVCGTGAVPDRTPGRSSSAFRGPLASLWRSIRPMKNQPVDDTVQPLQRDPDEWKTGDEPMTDAQRSYLETLCRETGEEFDEALSKAEASKRIGELRERSPRLQD